eukprot:18543-Heterococcus_DN1.PRE.1
MSTSNTASSAHKHQTNCTALYSDMDDDSTSGNDNSEGSRSSTSNSCNNTIRATRLLLNDTVDHCKGSMKATKYAAVASKSVAALLQAAATGWCKLLYDEQIRVTPSRPPSRTDRANDAVYAQHIGVCIKVTA